MKTKIITILAAGMLLGASPLASADIVSLDLFDLGCQTIYDLNSPAWTSDFDLGITFTEISNVYIDWTGEITGGLAVKGVGDPFPIDVGIGAYFEKPLNWRHTGLWGGEAAYPDPEPFDCLSEFLYGSMPWSELFDGQSTITIEYKELIILDGSYLEHGSVVLTGAAIVVDGVIIPEPASILLLVLGMVTIRVIRQKNITSSF